MDISIRVLWHCLSGGVNLSPLCSPTLELLRKGKTMRGWNERERKRRRKIDRDVTKKKKKEKKKRKEIVDKERLKIKLGI
jgi:hypothetical protein